MSISETFVEGQGQRARALYKLSRLQSERDMPAESEASRKLAVELRAAQKPELANAPFEEAEFAKLCLWMLW